MSWFESLSKEEFQAIIREALKEDLDALKHELSELIKLCQGLIRTFEMPTTERSYHTTAHRSRKKADPVQETKIDLPDRVSCLDGTLEDRLHSIMSEFKLDFYEKFGNALPEKIKRPNTAVRKRVKRAVV